MSTKLEILRKYIRELIQQELDEASVTGALDGGEILVESRIWRE